jgi:hypothetical protein
VSARVCAVLLAAGALALAGCAAKLNETKTASLDPADVDLVSYELQGQSAEQKLSVEVNSTDAEVDVYVVKAADAANFEVLLPKQKVEKAMAYKQGVKADTLTATVPPKTDVKVVVALNDKDRKKTSVTVKMRN